MAFPANLTTVTVVGSFITPEGTASTGTVTFTASSWLTNSGANLSIPNSAVTKTLGTAGDFSATIPITDDADISPTGWVYTVAEVVDGVSRSYDVTIPGTVVAGGTVYLADLTPAAAAGPEYYSLASSLSIGTVSTLAAGSAATATITGLAPNQTLNLGIPTGPAGTAGAAASIAVGTVTSVANTGTASVTNVGSSSAGTFDFVLRDGPAGATGATGATGAQGPAATVTVGTVGSVAYPGPGTVTNSGTSGAAVLDFVLVTGEQGATGPQGAAGSAATIAVGTVGTVAYPGPGTVTNSGSSTAGTFDFILVTGDTGPQGATGPAGPTGATGAAGSAATVTVGTVGAVAYPGPGTVVNSGSSSAAVLDFTLVTGQTGATGPQGPQGSAATVTVGSVTAVAYGGTASVTNTGTSGSAVLDFVLVTGPQGAIGDLTATAPIDYTSSTFSLRYGAGLGTASGGTLVADFSDATPQPLAAAGSAGSSTELARGDHAHARPTAADIGAVGTATTITAGTALAGGGDLSTSRTLNVTLSDATPLAVGTPAAGTAVTPSRADHVHEGTTLSSSTPAALGTAAAGTATTASRGDHVHTLPTASDVGAIGNSLISGTKGAVPVGTGSAVDDLAPGSNGQMLMADSGATLGLRYVDPPANRNLIYNGHMQVAARSTSVSSITTGGYYTADRWFTTLTGLGTWTQSIEADGPAGSGFTKSLKLLCTTADSSPAASDRLYVNQALEGQDVQRIAKGTASAKQLTLSFWVKSNVTGTYVVSLYDNDNNRVVGATYSVAASATWEKKNITFPADTTGVLDNDNAASFVAYWHLGAGTDRTSGTLDTTWASFTAANFAVGQTNVAAATNNYWQITGVQLETGPVATPFEFEPYEATLRKCQRYYQKSYNVGAAPGTSTETGSVGLAVGTNSAAANYFTLPITLTSPMRGAPTVTLYDLVGNSGKVTSVSATDLSLTDNQTGTADRIGENAFRVYAALNGRAGFYCHYAASAEL